jgi:His/Glu/Gln/Arg/opine family amino acid ABC transporter permease subunit
MTLTLLQETHYLAGGFVTNLGITVVAMGVGSVLGLLLALCRTSVSKPVRWLAEGATSLCRNVPSLVLLFYIAFMIPKQIVIGETVLPMPLWIKASLALTIPVIGFASDQSVSYLRDHTTSLRAAAPYLINTWAQYVLIILMASSTATVLGADEIVGRANVLIAKRDDPTFLLATYAYVSLWFLVSGLLISEGAKIWARYLSRRSAFQDSPQREV